MTDSPVPATAPAERITRTFVGLGVGEVIGRALAFATTLLLARSLGAESYGVIALALAVGLYLTKLTEFGLVGVGVKAVAEGRDGAAQLASAISTVRVLCAVTLAGGASLVAWLTLPEPERWVLPLSFVALLPLALDLRWVLVGLEDTVPVARARVVAEIATLVGIVALVRDASDASAAVLVYAGGFAVSSMMMWGALRARGLRCTLQWKPALALPLLRSGLPIAGQILLGLMIFNADLFFLRLLGDREMVGIYAAAYTPISFVGNIGYAYAYSVLPVLTRERAEGRDGRAMFAEAHVRAFTFTLPLAVGTAALAGPLIELAFGSPYARGGEALAWLIASVPFGAATALSWTALTACERQGWLLGATAIAALLNVVLNVLLIPQYGMAGAAAATVATEAFRAGLTGWIAYRDGLAPPALRRLVRPALATGAMLGALLWLDAAVWLEAPLAALVYAAALFALGGLRWAGGRLALVD